MEERYRMVTESHEPARRTTSPTMKSVSAPLTLTKNVKSILGSHSQLAGSQITFQKASRQGIATELHTLP